MTQNYQHYSKGIDEWPVDEDLCAFTACCAESNYGSLCSEDLACCTNYAKFFAEQNIKQTGLDVPDAIMFQAGEFLPDFATSLIADSASGIDSLV